MVTIKDYTCLEPYVGFRGVCEDIEAPLYVDDIPGIEAQLVSATAPVADHTGNASFLKLRTLAAKTVGRHFLKKLEEKYEIADVLERRTVGDIGTTSLVDSGKFTIYRDTPQVSLWVERIKIWVSQSGTVDISINGISTGEKTVTEGYNTISMVDVTGDEIEIEITGVDGVQLGSYLASGCDCGGSATLSGTGVAIVTFALKCDHILCLFAESLAFATWYMTASLLMEQVEFSDNKSPLARNSKESAGRIRARIMGTKDPITDLPNSSLYWSEIGTAVKRAVLDGPCVTCNTARWVEQHP